MVLLDHSGLTIYCIYDTANIENLVKENVCGVTYYYIYIFYSYKMCVCVRATSYKTMWCHKYSKHIEAHK